MVPKQKNYINIVCTSTHSQKNNNPLSRRKLHQYCQVVRLLVPGWVGGGSAEVSPSAIEAHAGALIQVHVGVTEEPLGHTLHVTGHLVGQLGGRHFQVSADLGAGAHLGDIEAVALP